LRIYVNNYESNPLSGSLLSVQEPVSSYSPSEDVTLLFELVHLNAI